MKKVQKGRVSYYVFEEWERFPVLHGYTTRHGGVSRGGYASMNLSLSRGDHPEDVLENRRIFSEDMGISLTQMVSSDQVHTTLLQEVKMSDAGLNRERSDALKCKDGLYTAERGLFLMTWYADCTPLYFYDKRLHVIALSHAGWRGTVSDMAGKTVEALRSAYGSRPEDLYAGIGPCISEECYEVGEELREAFFDAFGPLSDAFFVRRGKDHLDLTKANQYLLLRAGVSPEHIVTSGLCTMKNDDFYSHRRQGNERGNQIAFLMLK